VVGPIGSFPSQKGEAVFVDRARFTLLFPELILIPAGEGGAAFAYPSEYRIHQVGGYGEVVRIVEKDEAPTAITSRQRARHLEEASSSAPDMPLPELERETAFPETWPFFDALLSDQGGNLYARRVEAEPVVEGGILLDVFTSEGIYVLELVSPVDNIQAIRNGYLYARRFSSEMSCDQLVRYRIANWDLVWGTGGPP
ncbi:hypothetical protein ACFL3S_13600, partial [Gemmatimonadota bacterium]